MNKHEIEELYQESRSFVLDDAVAEKVNPSTLAHETLKFLGTLVNYYQPSVVMEFGSGLSTLFFASMLEGKPDGCIYTVDHSEQYLQQTKTLVGERDVTYFLAPIGFYGFRFKRFATYSNDYIGHLPSGLKFDIVLIDGPPGFRFGREAPLYQIAPFLKSDTLILLDDSNRPPEQEAIAHWQRVWPGRVDLLHFPDLKKGFSVLSIQNPSRTVPIPFGLREIARSWVRSRRAVRAERS